MCSETLLAFAAVVAVPAVAQDTNPAPNAMTPEQITAFNKAVTDFTAAQAAQQAGDIAGAFFENDAVTPAIRAAVQAQPTNIDNVNFLANALFATLNV